MENIGSLPLKKVVVESAKSEVQGKIFIIVYSNIEETKQRTITKTVIKEDGSYGTETIIVDDFNKAGSKKDSKEEVKSPIRTFIEGEEFFL